jgi:hypothetical protein
MANRALVAILTLTVFASVFTALPASAATPAPDPAEPAPGLTSTSQVQKAWFPDPSEPDGVGFCTFIMRGDKVHISTWNEHQGARDVASGHGWWENVDCPDGTRANVKIWLEVQVNGQWIPAGYGEKNNVYSDGGSANRAAAQSVCARSRPHYWRSIVDVDIVGMMDSPNKHTTQTVSVECLPQDYL